VNIHGTQKQGALGTVGKACMGYWKQGALARHVWAEAGPQSTLRETIPCLSNGATFNGLE